MNMTSLLYPFAAIGIVFLGSSAASAKDMTQAFDERHKVCLEKIAVDADEAYEDALAWRNDGGGRRARHCVAMALFALGHKKEAASRLEKIAKAPDGGSKDMRANFYAESADFWLLAGESKQAYRVSTEGLKLRKAHIPLRIARARAYALEGRYDYAETDLTSVLVFEPDNAAALRYRADARWQQGKIGPALSDVEESLTLDPVNVESALLRGKIKESQRTPDDTDGVETLSE